MYVSIGLKFKLIQDQVQDTGPHEPLSKNQPISAEWGVTLPEGRKSIYGDTFGGPLLCLVVL